ncbi:hypothetical protein C8R45DRAFT_1022399 [Mycena sanguinolenta]|nr:hypothetical protein C8R45DRAFT_1022399 [Mycena sanguinolenta]
MSSPFALRLGTNYCPTDQEDLEIRSLLVEPTLRIKELDDEIASLQKSIDKLVEERNGLQSYVEAHSALISHVRRLPRDVIHEIFLACMPTHRNCVMSATEAPILLGRICSAWRTISLTSPRLWAILHIVEPEPPGEFWGDAHEHKVAQRVEMTKTWLARSGECPLSISLHCTPDGENSIPFIEALILFAPRWQHIHFTIPGSLLFNTMGSLDVDMPRLESAAFYSPTIPHGQPSGSWNMLRGTRLSKLSLPGGLFVPETLPILWNQLTTLTIGGPDLPRVTTATVLSVLSRCYQLRSCKLLISDPRNDVSGHPIELPFLHTLAVRCKSAILLTRLSLPELRHFVFLGCFGEADYPTLTDFLTRSIRLESFEINQNAFFAPFLRESLRGLPPAVQRLRIRGTLLGGWFQAFGDATLEFLATPELLPALRHLIIDWGSHLSDAAVLQFITSRMPTLRCVEIQFDRDMTVDIMPDLQPFLDTGLAVSFNYASPVSLNFSPWEGLGDDPYQDVLSMDMNPRPMDHW